MVAHEHDDDYIPAYHAAPGNTITRDHAERIDQLVQARYAHLDAKTPPYVVFQVEDGRVRALPRTERG